VAKIPRPWNFIFALPVQRVSLPDSLFSATIGRPKSGRLFQVSNSSFLFCFEAISLLSYFRSLGYRFTDGAVEKQDQYLKRVAGIGRLYFAILVTRPNSEQSPHPHNLDNGWRWLTNFLNLDPQPDVCATLICEFLQVAGYQMWQCFGKQFVKLLLFIQTQYMPRLNKVDQGGPKARLEAFLAKIISEGKIDPAEGLLSPNFW
jgi:nucleoporin GLE1